MLLEQVVNGHLVNGIVVLWALEEEAQEALSAVASCTVGEVHEQAQVKTQRCCEDRVAAQEVDLDLHGIAHPAKDVDVVPTLFVVVAGRIVVDAHFVEDVAVEVGLVFGNENRLEGRELAHLFSAEVGGLVEHEAVAVTQNVGREPAAHAEQIYEAIGLLKKYNVPVKLNVLIGSSPLETKETLRHTLKEAKKLKGQLNEANANLRAKMTDAEREAEAQRESAEELEQVRTELRTIKYSKRLMGIGMAESDAENMAKAIPELEDSDAFFDALGKFVESVRKTAGEDRLQKFIADNKIDVSAGQGDSQKDDPAMVFAKRVVEQNKSKTASSNSDIINNFL